MKTVYTSSCTSFGHPEFKIQVEADTLEIDTTWITVALEKLVEDGLRVSTGELIELGPSTFRVSLDGEHFALTEPDFELMPITWSQGATRSLRLLRVQKDFAESYGFEPKFCNLRQSCIVGVDLHSATAFTLHRTASSDGSDTGWFIGNFDSALDYNDPNNLCCQSIYEAALLNKQLWPFLALPENCKVASSSDSFLVWRNGSELKPRSGSFAEEYRIRLAAGTRL